MKLVAAEEVQLIWNRLELPVRFQTFSEGGQRMAMTLINARVQHMSREAAEELTWMDVQKGELAHAYSTV